MNEEDLLKCLIQVIGRAAVPLETVRAIIGKGKKQIKAFNLCDGTRAPQEIARRAKIDQGNLSRTTARWVANGIMFRVGEGKQARLLHIFPVPEKERRGRK